MIRNITSVLLLAVFALSLLSGLTNARAAIDPCKVVVHRAINYGGESRTFNATEEVEYVGVDWEDTISSLEVSGGARVVIYQHAKYGGHKKSFESNDPDLQNDIMQPYVFPFQFEESWNDQVSSLKVFCPHSSVDKTTLAFGHLYNGSRYGAADYNLHDSRRRGLTLSNTETDTGRKLQWAIADKPDYVTIWPTATTATPGSIDAGGSTAFTVKINPTTMDNNEFFIIKTNSSDHKIALKATVHDTPTVHFIAPAIGSNGKVNMAVDEELTFEVESGEPDFRDANNNYATIQGYQWQDQLGDNTSDSEAWSPPNTDSIWNKGFLSPGVRTIYARMVDSNVVATEPVEIKVYVWDRPVVATEPPAPTPSSWLSGKYVGVVNQPITLQAAPTLATFESEFSASGLTTESVIGSGAGVFNDSSDVLSVTLDVSEMEYTAALWFKTTDANSGIFSVGAGTLGSEGNDRHIYLSNGNIYVRSWNSEIIHTSGINYADGNWHHVAHVYGQSIGGQRIYVDGVEQASGVKPNSDFHWQTNVNIGYSNDAGNRNFSGNIDDVGIFRRALSTTEIADLGTRGLTGREDGLIYFNTFDYDGPDNHKVSRYLWYDDSNLTNHLATQLPGHTTSFIFGQQNTNGKIYCVAVTNHGIQSDKLMFDLRVYPTLMAEAGNPYTGRPLKAVTLSGLVNSSGYPSATFSYLWKVDTNGDGVADHALTASSEPEAEYMWSAEGTYAVELTVTATTQEGLVTTATDKSTVNVEGGAPTALPGGPYRGGIAGGSFSPIQLRGNPPDFEESTDVGLIDTWQWTSGPKENGLRLDGIDDYVEIGNLPITDTVTAMAWIRPNSVNGLHAIAAQSDTYSFRVEDGNLAFTTPGIKDHKSPVNAQLIAGQWRHVAAVFVAKGDLNFYLDGELLSTVPASAMKEPESREFPTPTLIGSNQWDQVFNGSTDDVVIFDRALSQSEIQTIMERSPVGNELGLLGHWGFDEGGGDTTADLSGNGNDGILMGNPQFFSTVAENGIYNPTREYQIAGEYTIGLRVRSAAGKWSALATTPITIIDGKIEGRVKAADLRTPVKDVTIKLNSSHVDISALARVADNDSSVSTTGDGGLSIQTDMEGKYSFSNLPLGNYTLMASKGVGDGAHEFETKEQVTELTLDAPNKLAIDYTDLSVFPVGGRVVYRLQKNGLDVLVDNVSVTAQPVGSTSAIRGLPSTKSLSATQTNYSLPLFAGKYLFLAELLQHDIRIRETTRNYDSKTQLVTIEDARTDIDFVDYTTRQLTVFVEDSGGFDYPGEEITISGNNGRAKGTSDESEGKFVFTLNPGIYTVTVPGSVADDDLDPDTAPEQDSVEVDLTGLDQVVTLTIPVPIILSVGPAPKLFANTQELKDNFPELADENPEGYMFYYPPAPRTYTYTITATANGNPVEDFRLFVVDNVSEFTTNPATEQEFMVQGTDGEYTMIAGVPAIDRTVEPPVAVPKTITFRAAKDKYQDSEIVEEQVTVLGDVPVGTAARIVSVPVVNYLVLHDPPGDGSFSSFDDSLTVKGIVAGMKIKAKDGAEIPVYPSPWRDERSIKEFESTEDPGSGTGFEDLGKKGLLDKRDDTTSTGATFAIAAAIETPAGVGKAALGPLGFGVQAIQAGVTAGLLEWSDILVQYEISPHRHLETSSGDTLPDLVGPGKGDLYFGEGWTLGLQTKYRLGIKLVNDVWEPATAQIETYDILDRTNQYTYTIREIVNIIADLDRNIDQASDENQRGKLTAARNTWQKLLDDNLAYQWCRFYIDNAAKVAQLEAKQSDGELSKAEAQYLLDLQNIKALIEAEGGDAFEAFKKANSNLPESSETLILSAGPAFEYSRRIYEGRMIEYSTEVAVGSSGEIGGESEIEAGVRAPFGKVTIEYTMGASFSLDTGHSFGASRESGKETEQTVSFTLQDDDIGDNIATRVYADPNWGTPLFFADPGSVTSDPWEMGTNKAVDLDLTLIEQATNTGPFDYEEGAHYKLQVQYAGLRELESSWIDFVIYDLWTDNSDQMTVKFNGQPGPYNFSLSKSAPTATFIVSLYPPEKDWANSESMEYSVLIECDETEDAYQINRALTLKPTFADLRAPRGTIASPYDGQRISPKLFSTDGFKVQVISEDSDLQKIQLQLRAKQPDSVWEPWRDLSGMVWDDGGRNTNVTVFDREDRSPIRREFTFDWKEAEIKSLGVGEYQLRALATDKATEPNSDVDPPVVTFLVDDSPPSVLTTTPFYQDRENERIYRGELSATFTDDMRADDFSDRTFEVTDLLDNNSRVAGLVSYSPALRKAVFVPVTPFQANGFYRAVIRTDTDDGNGNIKRGLRDLAGNPLDQEFSWTFRTTDTPFEETWSISLSVVDTTDGSADSGKIASVAFGALDGEDEKDARSVPLMDTHIGLSFLDSARNEFSRDTRPADGRLEHHWFLVVDNATAGNTIQIKWLPSLKLTRSTRQYQVINLVEFSLDGGVIQTIPLNPTGIDPYGNPVLAYSYKATADSKYFRLDVMKANIVATTLIAGRSGWSFFSVPITPQQTDPFVNLGDDIDPFQMFQYDTSEDGYKVYPFDLGQVSLQTGCGYFTRLKQSVEVDVGGTSNNSDVKITLAKAGWHAIGNPFIADVFVDSLKFGAAGDISFTHAVETKIIDGSLYRWEIDPSNMDSYKDMAIGGGILKPWNGYFIKTLVDNAILTIPAPTGLANTVVPLPPSFNPPVLAPPAVREPKAGEFELRFALTSDSSADLITTLGTRERASVDYDSFDRSEPPRLKGTASLYFEHKDWDAEGGLYNRDFRPALQVGESTTWTVVAFTDEPDAKMRLMWEDAIGSIPDDIMMEFREADVDGRWRDMRSEKFVQIDSDARRTKVSHEIRATCFALEPISDLNVVAGEAKVRLQWNASENPYITGYTIYRNSEARYELSGSESSFIDTDVEEEEAYSYQIGVRFRTGAELRSELFKVTVLPAIKATVLLQNYPNPFNPETWLPYELSKDAAVSVEIYSVAGQLVRRLDIGIQKRGRYVSMEKAAYWDGRNKFGEQVASGTYFYVLRAGKDFSATRKLVILK